MRSLDFEREHERKRKTNRNYLALISIMHALGFFAVCGLGLYLYIKLAVKFATFGVLMPC